MSGGIAHTATGGPDSDGWTETFALPVQSSGGGYPKAWKLGTGRHGGSVALLLTPKSSRARPRVSAREVGGSLHPIAKTGAAVRYGSHAQILFLFLNSSANFQRRGADASLSALR